MNAAELDRYITAEKAYDDAKAAGASEQDAQDAARAAVAECRRAQVLRRCGLSEAEIAASRPPELVPENGGGATDAA